MISRVMLAAMLLALAQVAASNIVSAQVAASNIVSAQSAAPSAGGAGLNIEQHQGWLLTLQYCALCHTRTNLHSTTTIGPILSRESGGGRDDVVRQVIADGTPNMPGFKHQFEPKEIEAIVAYLKTVPPQAAKSEKH